ncbi:hypothetical protein HMPREF0072_0847 [Anaerococcus lactolyticus ATCC 51172]|uniref:Uncharacterized protein n=1 Tax=Anaerococcus lactolyticus ATCC 51172 TaxID=525254 RepID=C2BES7_9FIRM|nr:hypothetical protein HMPREF0072_0847 [Anaerococcus lactolyticus ATCC 51172]
MLRLRQWMSRRDFKSKNPILLALERHYFFAKKFALVALMSYLLVANKALLC